jgi:type VI secretion system secreted protein VgrG
VDEKYEITMPDGTVARGKTDSDGLAKVSGKTPGTCQVTFPDLDQDAWELM